MNYRLICPNCRAKNKLYGSFTDRRELSNKINQGDLKMMCSSCYENLDINANQIKAEEGKFLGLGVVLIFIPAISLGYYLFTGFSERGSLYLKSVAVFFALIIPAAIYFTAAELQKLNDILRKSGAQTITDK